MSKGKHIIHRVNLEIDAPDTATARQVQEDAIRILKNDILPVLEIYLDKLETGGQSLRLNEFNLNLAEIRPEDFETDFAAVITDKFRDQIEKIIGLQAVSNKNEGEAVTKFSKDESDFECFLYFLRTGRLPWWSNREDGFPGEKDLLLNPLLKKLSYRKLLLAFLVKNDHALERLLLQFQDEFAVRMIVSAITGKHPEKVHTGMMLKEIEASGIILKEKLRSVIAEFQQTFAESDAERSGKQTEKKVKLLATDHETEEASEKFADGLYVQNAGLVLLHPFLEYFFLEFKLLKDQKFVSRKAKTTAIHLLHFLATGKENPMEYELLFEKYLCGWDPVEVVPRHLKLNKGMKTESEKLLSAAIGHWKALKKTSPAGLREGFLQREGKLVMEDFHHRLVIQGNTTDALLSSLPWGYGMIKLPWLAQILIVDWNH